MDGWPMVSLPHGAASAKKDLKKQIPLLQGYEEICLFFDNDEAGRNAVEQAASILPAGKVTIARLEQYKDASDALQANDKNAICIAIWDAKAYQPVGIIDCKNIIRCRKLHQYHPCNHEYPFPGFAGYDSWNQAWRVNKHLQLGTGQGKKYFFVDNYPPRFIKHGQKKSARSALEII
jgi:hypothetical protein